MSRCFPFPPPGYERKNRLEDLDLVKEAEQKEKKHKKERKDKEKRKNKERKEKDGTDEKHRHKKHRKEKHKEKTERHKDRRDKEDRGKDKDKDKEKSSISEESTVAAKSEEEGGEKHNSRVLNYDNSAVDEERSSMLFKGQNGAKPFQNSLLSQETKESKFVQELDRRYRADETSRGSQLSVDVVTCLDTKDRETDARAAIRNSSGVSTRENEYNKNKRVDTRKIDVQEFRNEVGGRPVEDHKNRRWEGKEMYSETGDVKKENKHKDRDKKSHGKVKDKEKKREKAIVKIENKQSDQDRFKETGNSPNVGTSSDVNSDLFKESKNSTLNDGNINKRKEVASNGFLLESEVRPAKIRRLTPYQAPENGRKVEGCHTPSLSTPDRHVVPNSVRLVKERQINGVIEGRHKPSPSEPALPSTTSVTNKKFGSLKQDPKLNKISVVPMLDDLIMEALRRSPHPDSKCLNEVLTVPKLGEWPTDDQEWLFSKKGPSNELKLASFVTEDELCVWSEAVHMEADDVCALPYVIPY